MGWFNKACILPLGGPGRNIFVAARMLKTQMRPFEKTAPEKEGQGAFRLQYTADFQDSPLYISELVFVDQASPHF